MVGTYIYDFSEAVSPGVRPQQMVNTPHNPLSFRFRSELGYSIAGFGATSFVNFAGGYRDTVSVPWRGVSPWTTLDLQLSYETPVDAESKFNGVRLSVTVLNVAGTQPPFLNSPFGGFDQENAAITGRVIAASVRKRF
jgi:hypothetical protein